MDTVLAAIDYTGCGAEVVIVAEDLAKRMGARLVLLHAARLPAQVPPDLELGGHVHGTAAQALTDDARAALEVFAAGARALHVPVEVVVRRGAPARVILDAATELGASFVVVGSHGRTGLARLVLGSVAEEVMRHATVPVVTVRSQDTEAHPGPSTVQMAVQAEADG